MVITPEDRVVVTSFEFDGVLFEVGEEVRIEINEESSDAYGCVFATKYYDLHNLHFHGRDYTTDGHGFWVNKSIIDTKTVPLFHNRTPDWEV